ncbi:tripartite tricarboxylate transporter permease [Martelella mediterranea]|uniref:tripartite tricarboxylate transporter permease n=1 Tax=Martelella mediterranea TaxID=293089 RepID=UPI001E56E20C|nr:tripartite tricarboxylate transporter permease [Martelella mediterranea]MCD1635203.1 tripartite tricarboxylate transporter permease [Martelella mediterranea]
MSGYIFSALGDLAANPMLLVMIAAGVAAGLVIGSIPGLTSTMALALLVPLTFTMDFESSIGLLMGVYCGAISGGLVGAIVLNIPGTPAAAATCLDGYPMAKKGQLSRALGLGVYASMIGGVISGLALVLIAPALSRFAMQFGPWEYFAIVIFTFLTIASLSEGDTLKAVAIAMFGVCLSMIGYSTGVGASRFSFGVAAFEGGINVLPALVGAFALPQLILDTDRIGATVNRLQTAFRLPEFARAFTEVLSVKWALLRSTLIGIGIGILPGVGPGLSNILAYSQARASSKTPEKFGTGELPEAIVSPEAANNASMGGSLIPMLTLGIPGDASTLMLLSALMLHNVEPGPLLFVMNGDYVAFIFVAFFVSFAFCTIFYHLLIGTIIRVLTIPTQYIVSVIFVLCVIGSYVLNNRMFDVYTLLAFGVLGYGLRVARFPILPLILGIILGPMAEEQLRLALEYGRGSYLPFVTRPFSAVILALTLVAIVVPLLRYLRSFNSSRKGARP